MKVFVAVYEGTDGNEILGVFTNIKKAKECIHNDYNNIEFGYKPTFKEVDDTRIYIEEKGLWYDEWYVVETELYD